MRQQQKIDEAAARWFLRMQTATADAPERGQFEIWLMQSPLHQQAYQAITAAWEGLGSIDEMQQLAQAKQTDQFFRQDKRRKSLHNTLASLAVCVFLGSAGWLGLQQYRQWQAAPVMQLVQTSNHAQIVSRTLEDGSKVTLNANTHLDIQYYRHQRHVTLLQGEAIFEVEKDPQRPFVVETDRARITVLGTRFAVNKLGHLLRVSVDHGKVEVVDKSAHQAHDPIHSVILHNNQVAEVANQQIRLRRDVEASDYFLFSQGILVFNHAQMQEVSEELSRFSTLPVTCQCNSRETISAVVKSTDIHGFIHTLPRIAHVQIIQSPQETLIQTRETSGGAK